MVRDNRVISAVNDPNDYGGPGSGYRLSARRKAEIAAIRDVLDRDEVLRAEATYEAAEQGRIAYRSMGPARLGNEPNEVVIGAVAGLRPASSFALSPATR